MNHRKNMYRKFHSVNIFYFLILESLYALIAPSSALLALVLKLVLLQFFRKQPALYAVNPLQPCLFKQTLQQAAGVITLICCKSHIPVSVNNTHSSELLRALAIQ